MLDYDMKIKVGPYYFKSNNLALLDFISVALSYVSFVRCFLILVWFSFLTIRIDFYCAQHRVIPFFFSLSLSLKRNYFWVPIIYSTADV